MLITKYGVIAQLIDINTATITLKTHYFGYDYGVNNYVAYALNNIESYTNITNLASDIVLNNVSSIKFKVYNNTLGGMESFVDTTYMGSGNIVYVSGASTEAVYSAWISSPESIYYLCSYRN